MFLNRKPALRHLEFAAYAPRLWGAVALGALRLVLPKIMKRYLVFMALSVQLKHCFEAADVNGTRVLT